MSILTNAASGWSFLSGKTWFESLTKSEEEEVSVQASLIDGCRGCGTVHSLGPRFFSDPPAK